MVGVQEIFDHLLTPPGDLYYHLALLFTLQIFLAVAWGHRRRSERAAEAGRILGAATGLLLTRLLLIGASAIVGSGAASSAAILPPLERFSDLLLIPLAAWAFLPLAGKHPRLGIGLLSAAILAAALGYAYCAVTWPPAEAVGFEYNTYWQAPLWEATDIALAALALLALLIWPRSGLGLLAAALLTWLAGHLAQALLPTDAPHLAGFVRLTNLIAIPLVTAQGFQEALRYAPATTGIPVAATEPFVGLAQRIAQADDPQAALAAALPELARHLDVAVAAVGVSTDGTEAAVRIIATQPAGRPTTPILPLKKHPLLDAVVRTRQPQQTIVAANPGATALLHRLGLHANGPLRIEPLVHGESVIGMLLLADPTGRPEFSTAQVAQARLLAQATAPALARAQRWRLLQQERDQLAAAMGEQGETSKRRIAVLESELEQARREVQEFAGRAAELEQQAEQQRIRTRELAELVRLREEELATATATPVALYEEELRQAIEERDHLARELAQWEERARGLQAQPAAPEAPPQASHPPVAEPEIITSITQEMRTPMTSIIGYTDLLMSESVGILGEGQRKFIQRIKANIERLYSLINDLIEITSLDKGRIELTPEPVDITTIIEEAIMGLSAQFRERDLTVRLDMALELPRIPADRDSLYQIMLHLLSNACQCSRPGSEVLITSRLEEGREQLMSNLLISVTDTGGGIAREDLPHVFQRFYRADNPLIPGLGDTGVGLAIAKSLVEAQGGRIWVESVMGVGSTFNFILPFTPAAQATEG